MEVRKKKESDDGVNEGQRRKRKRMNEIERKSRRKGKVREKESL